MLTDAATAGDRNVIKRENLEDFKMEDLIA